MIWPSYRFKHRLFTASFFPVLYTLVRCSIRTPSIRWLGSASNLEASSDNKLEHHASISVCSFRIIFHYNSVNILFSFTHLFKSVFSLQTDSDTIKRSLISLFGIGETYSSSIQHRSCSTKNTFESIHQDREQGWCSMLTLA